MTGIFIIFMTIILLIAILLIMLVSGSKRDFEENNRTFLDEDGDHSYYDRSLIEKKEFRKRHPEIKDIRTFGRLFGKRQEDK